MKIAVPVNHNFYEESPIYESELEKKFHIKKSGVKHLKRDLFTSVYELKLGAERLNHIKIFKFNRNRFFDPDDERLILKFYSKDKLDQENEYIIQTGLYAGVLFHKGYKINITTKYGDTFLKRMLNFVNDIYVDTEQVKSKKDETENQFLFIIAYLFIQSLEKAAVLGLPQEYKKHKERSHKVKGSINFNEYLKRDIPFQGKLTTSLRERMYVQEIVDVLFVALRKLERIFGKEIHSRLLGLYQLLKQVYSGRYASYETIQKAKKHQSINNPMYSSFRKVLDYAEIILLDKDIMPESKSEQLATSGYLFDIADLFELYLEKLLKRNFPDWIVSGQEELALYQQNFFSRSMYPDLIMRHKESKKTVVFDAKFKMMRMKNKDVDRNDLHQIHSYSGYFRDSLIASGLIYPLSGQIDINKAHSNSIYGIDGNNIKFIVDGIYVYKEQNMENLLVQEDAFIHRIKTYINKTV